jgi:hypothetical protein
MNEYTIVSPRLGNPGDAYTPAEGINVEALLDGGFITKKTARHIKPTNEEIDTNGN